MTATLTFSDKKTDCFQPHMNGSPIHSMAWGEFTRNKSFKDKLYLDPQGNICHKDDDRPAAVQNSHIRHILTRESKRRKELSESQMYELLKNILKGYV